MEGQQEWTRRQGEGGVRAVQEGLREGGGRGRWGRGEDVQRWRCRRAMRKLAGGRSGGAGGPRHAARPRPLPGPPRPHAGPRRSTHRRACGPAWRGRGTPPPQGSTPPSLRPGWWQPLPAPCRPPRPRRPPQPPPWPGRPATSPQRERARPRAPRRRAREGCARGGLALGLVRGAGAGAAEHRSRRPLAVGPAAQRRPASRTCGHRAGLGRGTETLPFRSWPRPHSPV